MDSLGTLRSTTICLVEVSLRSCAVSANKVRPRVRRLTLLQNGWEEFKTSGKKWEAQTAWSIYTAADGGCPVPLTDPDRKERTHFCTRIWMSLCYKDEVAKKTNLFYRHTAFKPESEISFIGQVRVQTQGTGLQSTIHQRSLLQRMNLTGKSKQKYINGKINQSKIR